MDKDETYLHVNGGLLENQRQPLTHTKYLSQLHREIEFNALRSVQGFCYGRKSFDKPSIV